MNPLRPLFLLFVIVPFSLLGQTVYTSRFLRNIGISSSLALGYDVTLRTNDIQLGKYNKIISGAEFGIVYLTDGDKEWNKLYNNPRIGINVAYYNLPLNSIFGKAITLIPYIDFNWLNLPKTFGFFRVGMGAAYMNKYFIKDINPFNQSISTRGNFAYEFAFGIHHNIIPNMELDFMLGAVNISNGTIKTPNQSYTVGYFKMGVSAFFYDRMNTRGHTVFRNKLTNLWYWQAFGGGGYKSMVVPYQAYQAAFPVASFSGQYLYAYNKIFNYGFAVDMFFDATPNVRTSPPTKFTNVKFIDKFHAAAGFASEFQVGKISFPFQLMHYVYNLKFVGSGGIYHKIGVRYTGKSNFFMGINFKNTLDPERGYLGDFTEFYLGYRRRPKPPIKNVIK